MVLTEGRVRTTPEERREDIHPLEEAVGFRSLLNLNDTHYTVAGIAAKAGKSEANDVQRC